MNKHLRIPLAPPEPPTWAGGFGADRYGVFAELVLGEVVHRLRWIDPGRFDMGSPQGEAERYSDEGPVHGVRIDDGFWLGETPVTQEFYKAVSGANPSRFAEGPKEADKRPVEQVSSADARAFCERLTGLLPEPREDVARLPSEAEWEYACRAGTGGALYAPYGEEEGQELTSMDGRCPNLDRLAWYGENSGRTTHPVKGKLPNHWGLYDMLGNVWEWCEDHWHNNYDGAPEDGSPWVDEGAEGGATRVVRGGSWFIIARNCRCAYRSRFEPGIRLVFLGFRLVLAPSSTRASVPFP